MYILYKVTLLTSVDVVPLMKTAGVVKNSGHCIYSIYMFNCFHLKKSLYSKRRELNKVILRAVSYIVLLRCYIYSYMLHICYIYSLLHICIYIHNIYIYINIYIQYIYIYIQYHRQYW